MVSKTGWVRLLLAGASLMAAFVLVACSDDEADGATDPAATATSVSGGATATPASEGAPTDVPGTGAGDATAVPPGFPASDEPPATVASANGVSVETGTGTYCWTLMCVDKIGVPTKGTLTVAQGDTVAIAIPENAPPLREATATVFEAQNSMPLDDGSDIWPYPGAPGDEVASEVTGESVAATIDLAPGRYVLAVFMSFEAGDVVYGVLVEVQ